MKLSTCPFCGSDAVLAVRDDPTEECHWFWVTCKGCDISQPNSKYRGAGAAELAWNGRYQSASTPFHDTGDGQGAATD